MANGVFGYGYNSWDAEDDYSSSNPLNTLFDNVPIPTARPTTSSTGKGSRVTSTSSSLPYTPTSSYNSTLGYGYDSWNDTPTYDWYDTTSYTTQQNNSPFANNSLNPTNSGGYTPSTNNVWGAGYNPFSTGTGNSDSWFKTPTYAVSQPDWDELFKFSDTQQKMGASYNPVRQEWTNPYADQPLGIKQPSALATQSTKDASQLIGQPYRSNVGIPESAVRESSIGQAVERAANPTASKQKGILDLIGRTEGTDRGRGYNETLGYGAYTGGNVDLTNMTLGEVRALQNRMLAHPNNKWNSSAVGRYQIVGTTLDGLKKEMGLSDDEKFTPELQDRMAVKLLERRGLNEWKAGKISDSEFTDRLAKEWASLPQMNGKGAYGGQNAAAKPQEVLAALNAGIGGGGSPILSQDPASARVAQAWDVTGDEIAPGETRVADVGQQGTRTPVMPALNRGDNTAQQAIPGSTDQVEQVKALLAQLAGQAETAKQTAQAPQAQPAAPDTLSQLSQLGIRLPTLQALVPNMGMGIYNNGGSARKYLARGTRDMDNS